MFRCNYNDEPPTARLVIQSIPSVAELAEEVFVSAAALCLTELARNTFTYQIFYLLTYLLKRLRQLDRHYCTLCSMRCPLLWCTDDVNRSRDEDDGDVIDGRVRHRRGPEVARQDRRSSVDDRSTAAERSIIDAKSPL